MKSLERRQFSAEFFLDEIRRRMGVAKGPAPRKSRVLIVLSSLVRFASGQEVHPIALDGPTDTRVFYIRYRAAPQAIAGRPPTSREKRGRMPAPDLRSDLVGQFDQLEPLLKPLDPRLFEVSTPEQFRKALAAILVEIASCRRYFASAFW